MKRYLVMACAALALSACMSEPALADHSPGYEAATIHAEHVGTVHPVEAFANARDVVVLPAAVHAVDFKPLRLVDVGPKGLDFHDSALTIVADTRCSHGPVALTAYMEATPARAGHSSASPASESRDEVRGLGPASAVT